MEILRGNYNQRICMCRKHSNTYYKCKFANGDIELLKKEEITFFNNSPAFMNKYKLNKTNW